MSHDLSDDRKVEIADIMCIMQRQGGRDFIRRCLRTTGVYSDTFSIDHSELLVNTGMRKVGLWLDEELRDAVPDLYMKMTEERIEDD